MIIYGVLIMSCYIQPYLPYRSSPFFRIHKNSSSFRRWNPQHLTRLFPFVPEETVESQSRWILVVSPLSSFFVSAFGFSATSTMDLGIIKWRKKIEVASQTNKKIYSVLVLGRSFALAVILRQNTRLNEPFINYWWLFPMTAEYRTPNALFRVP